MKDVSIIIVNYNTYKLTCACIQSVLGFTKGVIYEIILVDNNSVEEEPVRYEALFPEIIVLRLNENLGFAKGNNAGLSLASGKYILLLNSDTELFEDSISITYRYMEVHPKAGVVSARLIFSDGRHQSVAQRFPSIKYMLLELFRLQKIVGKEKGGRLLLGSFFDHNSNAVVDWVWGAYFMFPRHIINKMKDGKLNDSYFMYAEDMQWCLDIKRLGYKVHYCAETSVTHIMGGSSANKSELMVESENLFFKKNFSSTYLFVYKKFKKLLSLLGNS